MQIKQSERLNINMLFYYCSIKDKNSHYYTNVLEKKWKVV